MKKIYEISTLLTCDCIWKEVDDYILGYHLDEVNYLDDIYYCNFSDGNGKLMLMIKKDSISLNKVTKDEIQVVNIKDNLILNERKIEKRENGILVTDIRKIFGLSKKYRKALLKNINEKRILFSKEKLQNLFKNLNFENDPLMLLHLKLSLFEKKNKLSNVCDLYNVFSVHSNDEENKVYINCDDISHLYKIIDGPNKVYEIYNLYKGEMIEKTKNDILSIRLNLLSEESFNLIERLKIAEKEENLIGKSSQKEDVIKVYNLK